MFVLLHFLSEYSSLGPQPNRTKQGKLNVLSEIVLLLFVCFIFPMHETVANTAEFDTSEFSQNMLSAQIVTIWKYSYALLFFATPKNIYFY